MPNKIVNLSTPTAAGALEIQFREPTFADYMAVGEPYVWAPRGDGYLTPATIHENVKRYAEMLIVDSDGTPGDPLILASIALGDAFKVKEAIVGFFLDADPGVDRSKTSRTTSSSSSAGAPPTSAG